jgi:hypothetical protein
MSSLSELIRKNAIGCNHCSGYFLPSNKFVIDQPCLSSRIRDAWIFHGKLLTDLFVLSPIYESWLVNMSLNILYIALMFLNLFLNIYNFENASLKFMGRCKSDRAFIKHKNKYPILIEFLICPSSLHEIYKIQDKWLWMVCRMAGFLAFVNLLKF